MKIISIGDLVTDFYYKNGKLIGLNGGMTSHNIIANIAKMGLDTAVYGVCGNDSSGNVAMNSLIDVGVNVENIKVIDNLNTRCFHVSYFEENERLEFKSKKRCPLCNEKKWYEDSKIDCVEILKKINKEDILIFDNLNEKSQTIIDGCTNKKMLDLGQYFEFDNYNNEEVVNKIFEKFEIINLNERVEKYLQKRFSLNSLEDIYKLLKPKMIIITRGKKGSDFILDNQVIIKKLTNPVKELDSTGAGDAFFSIIISEYIKNDYILDSKFIDNSFDKATKVTKKVVKKFGARGHIQSLYKIKKLNICTCNNFEILNRRKPKRCNINVNNLEARTINAVNSDAYEKILTIKFEELNNTLFTGTGGSYAGAKFASKVVNYLYGTNTQALYPRDVFYRNNCQLDTIFLFTYSGTTSDLITSTSLIDNKKKYVITKGKLQDIVTKTGIPKSNIISYRTGANKGKERGFLSFEGALSPASLFLKLYLEKTSIENANDFIKNSINYWKDYFNIYFKENKHQLRTFLTKGNFINIFTGDFSEVAGNDLESKIIESGIYNCLIHEKKNFSHGRFINYEHLGNKKNIYFKQKNINSYEKKLLDYLLKDETIIVESRYDGILCEYDLLVASQYLIYYISNFINVDVSKPSYTEDALKLYFYKGEL